MIVDDCCHSRGKLERRSYLIAGWMPFDEFADLLSLEIDADRDYETVAGLVLDAMGHLPGVGQRLELQGWTGDGSTSFWSPDQVRQSDRLRDRLHTLLPECSARLQKGFNFQGRELLDPAVDQRDPQRHRRAA